METQESTFELTLKLSLPGKTLKKLKSYAMLSGMSVDELERQLVSQVEPELSAHFDKVLTEGIVGKLSEMDGVELSVKTAGDEYGEEGDSDESAGEDDHQLSGEDMEEVKSLAEQYEQEEKAPAKTFAPSARRQQPEESELSFDIRVPDAGGDAEKFLDASLESDMRRSSGDRQSSGGTAGPYGSYTGAAKRFVPGKPRVRISEHTGDESGFFS